MCKWFFLFCTQAFLFSLVLGLDPICHSDLLCNLAISGVSQVYFVIQPCLGGVGRGGLEIVFIDCLVLLCPLMKIAVTISWVTAAIFIHDLSHFLFFMKLNRWKFMIT